MKKGIKKVQTLNLLLFVQELPMKLKHWIEKIQMAVKSFCHLISKTCFPKFSHRRLLIGIEDFHEQSVRNILTSFQIRTVLAGIFLR